MLDKKFQLGRKLLDLMHPVAYDRCRAYNQSHSLLPGFLPVLEESQNLNGFPKAHVVGETATQAHIYHEFDP